MTFLIKDDKLLEKYNEIWEKVSKIIYKEFDSNPVYNEKYIKTKIKVYNSKVKTNFHGNKIPNASLEYVCLSVILLDSVHKKDNKYYPEWFLEECKYVVKEKKIHDYTIDDVDISSDSDEQALLEKIQMEKNPDYEENSDEESMEKSQVGKNSDEKN